jgi:hypothetical protein
MSATAIYSRPDTRSSARDQIISAAQIRALSDDELLERWEDTYGACLNETDSARSSRLRQHLDALTKEASGPKRKLISWQL